MAARQNIAETVVPAAVVELGEDVSGLRHLMVIKADAEAYKATDAAGVRVIGVNEEEGDEGDEVSVRPGYFWIPNSASNPVTAAHIGTVCYVETSVIVQSAVGSHSVVAGTVENVDATAGVLVHVGVGAAKALTS